MFGKIVYLENTLVMIQSSSLTPRLLLDYHASIRMTNFRIVLLFDIISRSIKIQIKNISIDLKANSKFLTLFKEETANSCKYAPY